MPELRIIDLAVVGAGPAGLAAGMHAARAGLSHRVFDPGAPGGLMRAALLIENPPGMPEEIAGHEMADLMSAQAKRLGVRVLKASVESIVRTRRGFRLLLSRPRGAACEARCVILATGTRPLLPSLPGLDEAAARGLAHTDVRTLPAALSQTRIVISGGGDAAFNSALNLAGRGVQSEIWMRGAVPRARPFLVRRARGAHVRLCRGRRLVSLRVEGGELAIRFSGPSGRNGEDHADHLLVCHGRAAENALLTSLCGDGPRVSEGVNTSVRGLFAAGDLIHGRCRYVATAVGDGTRAGWLAEAHLRGSEVPARSEREASYASA